MSAVPSSVIPNLVSRALIASPSRCPAVSFAVSEPRGRFADTAATWVIAGYLGDAVHSFEATQIVLLEYHAARSQLHDCRLNVVDLPSQLMSMVARRRASRFAGSWAATSLCSSMVHSLLLQINLRPSVFVLNGSDPTGKARDTEISAPERSSAALDIIRFKK